MNAGMVGRMERNKWNYVTLQSADLGRLASCSVQRDSSGNAPDWFLDCIEVRSATYKVSGVATFAKWIDRTAAFTAPVT